jgi:fumarate reductase subunit C
VSASEAKTPAELATRTYKPVMPAAWWTRSSHYFWYMVREFTALPLAVWLLWLLLEIKSAGNGAAGYSPQRSLPFVIFSVVCLLFALYHSITFLSLTGVIIHPKVLGKPVPSRLIVGTMFAVWLGASIVIEAVLIGFAR